MDPDGLIPAAQTYSSLSGDLLIISFAIFSDQCILLPPTFPVPYLPAFKQCIYLHLSWDLKFFLSPQSIKHYIKPYTSFQGKSHIFNLFENVKFFCNIFSKKIFNIVYLLFIIYNDIIQLQLQLFLPSFLKKCIEKRLSSGSHFLYAPLSFILLIFPFH